MCRMHVVIQSDACHNPTAYLKVPCLFSVLDLDSSLCKSKKSWWFSISYLLLCLVVVEQIGPNGDIEYLAEMGGILRFCEIQVDVIKLYKSLKELHVDSTDMQSDVTVETQELEVCFTWYPCLSQWYCASSMTVHAYLRSISSRA